MSVQGLGRVKTKSDLVVMPSGRQIFFCSPHDRRAQNSGCGYTAQSFYTARVNRDRGVRLYASDVRYPSVSDQVLQRRDRRDGPIADLTCGKSRIGGTLLPTSGMRAAPWVGGPAFVLIRGGFHATFFHLDVPEFLAQATASDNFGQGVPLVPARFIIGVRQVIHNRRPPVILRGTCGAQNNQGEDQ